MTNDTTPRHGVSDYQSIDLLRKIEDWGNSTGGVAKGPAWEAIRAACEGAGSIPREAEIVDMAVEAGIETGGGFTDALLRFVDTYRAALAAPSEGATWDQVRSVAVTAGAVFDARYQGEVSFISHDAVVRFADAIRAVPSEGEKP